MDALTFGTPRLIRNLMAAASQKLPINVYEYNMVGQTPRREPDCHQLETLSLGFSTLPCLFDTQNLMFLQSLS